MAASGIQSRCMRNRFNIVHTKTWNELERVETTWNKLEPTGTTLSKAEPPVARQTQQRTDTKKQEIHRNKLCVQYLCPIEYISSAINAKSTIICWWNYLERNGTSSQLTLKKDTHRAILHVQCHQPTRYNFTNTYCHKELHR